MPRKESSALTPENLLFCHGISSFIRRRHLSLSELSRLCDGHLHSFSKTAAARFVRGEVYNSVVQRMRPILLAAINKHLAGLGLTPAQVHDELTSILENTDLPEETTDMLADRCNLLPEAIRHFSLRFDPFDVDRVPELDQIFTNNDLDSVVARVKDAVQYQRFVAVIGGVGTGKTLLKMRVAAELEDAAGIDKVRLIYPEFYDYSQLSVSNIANAILAELGVPAPQDKARRVARVKQVLTGMQQDGVSVALVIDEAHRLCDKVMSSFKNFWEMTNGRSARLLGVILLGQPSFVEARMRDPRFSEIRQRVQIIHMPAFQSSPPYQGGVAAASADGVVLGRGSTAASYIAHRLKLAGGDIDRLFDTASIERICINATTPLALGNLVNSALMAAMSEEETKVSIDLPFFKTLSTGQTVLGMRKVAA